MASLFEMIIFEYQRYSEITDPKTKEEIERLVARLKPLEEEILKYKEGTVSILKSGNIFVSSFPETLSAQIHGVLSGNE